MEFFKGEQVYACTLSNKGFDKSDKMKIEKNNPAAQAAGQILPDANPPVGKLPRFSKIAVTFEPIQQFRYLQDLESL